ncbi:MAG: uroporphyrinogen decarboxylase family protein, partial [Clostridia bacterium]|nr:uroporphyrinogen decarboxylase family protein [Clostridia bacterium]
ASTYSPMFSPELFEKYMLPRYKRIIEECQKAGCRHFYFHSDGNILPVMDMLIEAGFEGFNPLEPRSGLGLLKLREKYGKKIILFGGICNTEILPSGDRALIKSHVEPLVELAKDGGVVLGTASVAGDVPPEAYDYCMKLIRELQGLPV